MVTKKHFFSLPIVVALGLLLIAGTVAYLTGGPASFFGHSEEEIEDDITLPLTNSCFYKFCSAACPNDYYAVSGSCETVVDFPNNASGYQYNLSGVLPDLREWNCFNDDLANDGVEAIQASVVCARTGGWSSSTYQSCGNYRIEDGTPVGGVDEACDKTNFGDWLDCTDFQTQGGLPLCNGELSCRGDCGGFDVSNCVYCNNGCPPGQTLCANNTCQLNCSGSGGNAPGFKKVGPAGGNCLPGQPCPGLPNFSLSTGFCGDGIANPIPDPSNGELCESDGDCSGYPTFGVQCPDGTSISAGQVCVNCNCEPNPTPCCTDVFGQPECTNNNDCGLGMCGHDICVLGCCVPIDC